ncbi:MAG TPA: GntG family PLP-dependent aldolase [Hyphomicrobiaceae bacterium]
MIDLYSDTSTRPTPGMRQAMANADVGDEQRGEDPTTTALEERIAALLGKEAAVFLPSGTMCNQIALLVHCRPGDEVIGAAGTHVFTSEAGGGSALAGAQTWPIVCDRGIFDGSDLGAAIREPSRHSPRSRLVVVEQTVNRGGGAIWPVEKIEAVAELAHRRGLAVHMDGARLMNAVVATGIPARVMAARCDSVWLDLSKGLGCPVGGVLAGSRDFIDEAWRWKQRIGGAMRQSGILAAAGLYALDHHVERLADDHANAALLSERIREIPGVRLMAPRPETNIVYFDTSGTGLTAKAVTEALLAENVRMGTSYGGMIRAVTHLDVSRDDVEAAAAVLRRVLDRR